MRYDSELTEKFYKLAQKEGVVAEEEVNDAKFILVYVGEYSEYAYAIIKVRSHETTSDLYDDQEEAFSEFHALCGHEMD